jgi:hypothetical protein
MKRFSREALQRYGFSISPKRPDGLWRKTTTTIKQISAAEIGRGRLVATEDPVEVPLP